MKQNNLPQSATDSLFANNDPNEVWFKAFDLIRSISPGFDHSLIRTLFDDVVRMFHGDYPDYAPIQTLYHDLPHTLDVFMCTVRLLHGLYVSGTTMTDDELTLAMSAALLHDIGYAQRLADASGTGAQFTHQHVRRGIEFTTSYFTEKKFPLRYMEALEPIILATDLAQPFEQIDFPDERTKLLGQIIVSADMIGQMADRTYLEKLLFLYMEFSEARLGNYENIHDMLRQTGVFYTGIREKLDEELGGQYHYLTQHFKHTLGQEKNFYLESIEKNIDYLSKIIALDDAEHFSMLKRGSIVEKSQSMARGASQQQ